MTDPMQAAIEAAIDAAGEYECLNCLSSLTVRDAMPDMLGAALPHLRVMIRPGVADEIAASCADVSGVQINDQRAEAPPALADSLMRLREVCGDTDVMAERIKQAALLEAVGADPGAVTALAKAAAQGVMTPDDLIRINSAGISVRPVVDWVLTQGKEKP